jgi:hypothetical protein
VVQVIENLAFAVSAASVVAVRSAAAIALEVTRCRTKRILVQLTRDDILVLDRRANGETFAVLRAPISATAEQSAGIEGD